MADELAEDPHLAWLPLDEFRRAWDLAIVGGPDSVEVGR